MSLRFSRFKCIPPLLGALGFFACWRANSSIFPTNLLCEYRTNPEAIDEPRPRLEWRLTSPERSQKQSAWQILAASSDGALSTNGCDFWDSGIISNSMTHTRYAGRALNSGQQCFWKLRVWDNRAAASKWSRPAKWSMGLKPEDWKAEYISYRDYTPVFKDPQLLFLPPARLYRNEFVVTNRIRRAVLYSTALGIYEAHLNGGRVGDEYFSPGWTDYKKRLYYQTHDVTDRIKQGTNALGALVSEGWYSGYLGFAYLTGIGTEKIGRYTYGKTPAYRAQLEIEYVDGTSQTVVTDKTWKVAESPVHYGDLLMGEYFDARLEQTNWCSPGFDARKWESTIRAEENGNPEATFYEYQNPGAGEKPAIHSRKVNLGFTAPGRLESHPGVPIRAVEELAPVSITNTAPGVCLFDLGQNIAGIVRLKVKGLAGTQVHLRYGEMLLPGGVLLTNNLRNARSRDDYILRGEPAGETYTPHFTYHGFRYVEVSGLPGPAARDTITGIVLGSDISITSDFECSDPIVHRIHKNIVWSQRANFMDVPTDCPQRDERLGWLADAQVFLRTAAYNADVRPFFKKWMRDIVDAQRPNGIFPSYAPYPYQHEWNFASGWCDAPVIIAYTLWQMYGDTSFMEEAWPALTRFMEWRGHENPNELSSAHGNLWGDWLSLGEDTPPEFIDSIEYGKDARMMGLMAEELSRSGSALVGASKGSNYQQLFQRLKAAFQAKYLKPDNRLAVETQTAYALATTALFLPDQLREGVGSRLAERIRSNGNRLTTGLFGTPALLPALTTGGQNEVAFQLLQRREFPGWGYEINQGATTIWERWDSYRPESGLGGGTNAPMNSLNHFALGSVGEWLFSTLAGISAEDAGFNKIFISPIVPAPGPNAEPRPITWVSANYRSAQGDIFSAWTNSAKKFILETEIPPNTTGTVFVRGGNTSPVIDEVAGGAESVKVLHREPGWTIFSIGSGRYRFVSTQ